MKFILQLSFCFLYLCILSQIPSPVTTKNVHLLSRKKRYLVFREGSNFEAQIALTKPLGFNFPSDWNIVTEIALDFKLPNTTLRYKKYKNRPYILHRRDRRQVYQYMEAILDSQGVSGRDCILRTICEASQLLGPGESLLQDLLHVIFRFPSAEEGISNSTRGYDVAASRTGCEPWTDTCPFSLLAILLAAT